MKCESCPVNCCGRTGVINAPVLMPYEIEQFSEREQDGFFWRLKRVDGFCTFFKEGRCTIYATRPLECRLYPYILTPVDGKPALTLHDGCWDREAAVEPEIPPEVYQLNPDWLKEFRKLSL